MRIAINTRFLLSHKMEGFGWYTYEIAKRLVQNHPEHEFYFFFDRTFDEKFVFGPNVTPVVLRPPARHPILFYVWFEWSVKRALIRYKIDLFFSPDGYLSLGSAIRQVGVIHDINFEHNPQDLKRTMRRYYQKYFPLFAKKADAIITVSEYSKQDLCSTYRINESKVHAIWNGCSEAFVPLPDLEKQVVRDKHTNGKPYIIFVGALHPRKNVGRLVQAFIQLKQDHPEIEHKLLIVGEELWANGLANVPISEDVRNQVHFSGHLDLGELTRVMGAATLLAYVTYFEGFGIPLVEAMRSGVPILSGDRTSLPEVAGSAARYCDPFSVEEIATNLYMLLSSPEELKELAIKGLERSKLFSWDTAAEEVWKVLEAQMK